MEKVIEVPLLKMLRGENILILGAVHSLPWLNRVIVFADGLSIHKHDWLIQFLRAFAIPFVLHQQWMIII